MAGVPGDRGVTALGAVGVVSSSLPGTAHGPSPGMVASTVRAAVPASVPATPRTAQLAQVRSGRDGIPWKALSLGFRDQGGIKGPALEGRDRQSVGWRAAILSRRCERPTGGWWGSVREKGSDCAF